MPYSATEGKAEAIAWIKENTEPNMPVLDIGPGAGWWGKELRKLGFDRIDAVEVFPDYIKRFGLNEIYDTVHHANIVEHEIDVRDGVAILGDVMEHLLWEHAIDVLAKLQYANFQVVISVPWSYPQGACEGNDHEKHIQDDLTPDIMHHRYPMLKPIFKGEKIGVYVFVD